MVFTIFAARQPPHSCQPFIPHSNVSQMDGYAASASHSFTVRRARENKAPPHKQPRPHDADAAG